MIEVESCSISKIEPIRQDSNKIEPMIFSGLAKKLMDGLEVISDKKKCYFVDLFVRVSNKLAIGMYEKLGYIVYR